MADVYRKVFDRLPRSLRRRIDPLEFSIESFVRSAAKAPKGALVLDAGAGESRFAGFFRDHRYLALDCGIGDGSWDYSQLHLYGDLTAIPLRSQSVDVALNTQVLEHVPDPGLVLAELNRVLKEGGFLYLTAPQGWPEHQQPHDYFRFTRWGLEHLLTEAGFSQIKIQPQGGYFLYLGHRLTYIPRVLFGVRRGVMRGLLLPLELIAVGLFCFWAPLLCFYLDRFDRDQEFTLGYQCIAVRGPRRP